MDGMNPFSQMSSSHSVWPVLLLIYNLPPWLCNKRKCMIMPILILGPQQPDNDIDVYLRPLVDDLKTLWSPGIEVYNGHRKAPLTLYGMLLCTITDLPGGRSVYGQCKEEKDCPHCLDDTETIWLNNSKKRVYIRNRCVLPQSHPYRGMNHQFDGTREIASAPRHFSGEEVYNQVKDLPTTHGKKSTILGKQKRDTDEPEIRWKKKSILWELPYWKVLAICHSIDAMHVKNVCGSLLATLINENKFIPMKAHDCEVMLTTMLVVGIRKILPEKVRMAIMSLCFFFNSISKKSWVHPEGSMVQGYSAEEVVDWCLDFIDSKNPIGIPKSRHEGRLAGTGTIREKTLNPDKNALRQAHFLVPQHTTDVSPYIDEHKDHLHQENMERSDAWCRWVQGARSVMKDTYWFTTVDLEHVGYKEEPFVLVDNVSQVFYVADTRNKKQHVVLPGKRWLWESKMKWMKSRFQVKRISRNPSPASGQKSSCAFASEAGDDDNNAANDPLQAQMELEYDVNKEQMEFDNNVDEDHIPSPLMDSIDMLTEPTSCSLITYIGAVCAFFKRTVACDKLEKQHQLRDVAVKESNHPKETGLPWAMPNLNFICGQPMLKTAALESVGPATTALHEYYMKIPAAKLKNGIAILLKYLCRLMLMETKEKGLPIGFLDLEVMKLSTIRADMSYMVDYVRKAFQSFVKEFIMFVHNPGDHWLLVVLIPKWGKVLYFDSQRTRPRDHTLLKDVLDEAFLTYSRTYKMDTSKPIHVTKIPCYQQHFGNECGFYTAHHMILALGLLDVARHECRFYAIWF
uniref:Ubiquitin-like protease family profile domain-containing protein n=1 Tax=Oryza brachyantha TaxID=4533 RepID=J3NCM6_ORYBR